jgi:hypothetical protein
VTNLPLAKFVGVLFGVCFTLVGFLGVRAGLASYDWTSAPATIIESERVGMGDHQSSKIVAEFKVGPYWYHCGRVRMGVDNSPKDAAAFPLGFAAIVSYDPEHLERCALIPGVSGGSLMLFSVGLAGLLLAAYAHVKMKRGKSLVQMSGSGA